MPEHDKPIVLQSCRDPGDPPWLAACLDSVAAWAEDRGWEYRRIGDDLFDPLSAGFRGKTLDAGRPAMAADLARLLWLDRLLAEGRPRAAWFDADVLVFDAPRLAFPDGASHAFGREVWVQPAPEGRGYRAHRNVHNAVAAFANGDPVLGFLINTVETIVSRATAPLAPQTLGPKLLTALHNVVGFPLIETAGALSPLVLADIAGGGGPAFDLMRRRSVAPLAAANLGASLRGRTVDGVAMDDALYAKAIERLRQDRE